MRKGMQRKVLIVEQASAMGGSVASLYQLVRGLDRVRFEPVLALSEANPYLDRFRALDVEVIPCSFPNRAQRDTAALGAVKQMAPVQNLREFEWGRKVYHGAGFVVKHLPAILANGESFAHLLRKVRPDFVHLNDVVPAHRAEILGAAWGRAPVLCHVRSFEPMNWFDRWLAGRVQRYIFISKAIAEWFAGTGVKVQAGDVVYNGVDAEEFRPLPEARAEMRDRLGLPADAQVAAIVGRVVPWKGHEIFVQALERLASRVSPLVGLVVGSASGSAVEFERQLRAKVDAGPMRGRVVFAGDRQDVNRVLAAVDVLVHASVEPEPFGRVIVEGMAAGVPVVASAAGAVPELIEDGRTGLLFPPGDHLGLASAVERLLTTPDLAERLKRNARRQVEMQFRSELYVAGVEAVYEVMV